MGLKSIALAAGLIGMAGIASASSIQISSFDVSDYQKEVGLMAGAVISEDFESFTVGNVDDGFLSSVGTFATIGGTGSGGTVKKAKFDNDGTKLAIRDGTVFGRQSTTKLLTGDNEDDQFLDSNDTYGIRWVAKLAGDLAFDRLILTMTDAADVGASLRVSDIAGGEATLNTAGNGNRQMIVVDFGSFVSEATLLFENRRNGGNLTNDGFSLDDIALNTRGPGNDGPDLSPVPLPAGVILLGTALGGLGLMRRRKKIA